MPRKRDRIAAQAEGFVIRHSKAHFHPRRTRTLTTTTPFAALGASAAKGDDPNDCGCESVATSHDRNIASYTRRVQQILACNYGFFGLTTWLAFAVWPFVSVTVSVAVNVPAAG